MKAVFPATDAALQDVNQFVETQLEEAGCTPKNMMKIMIALEELFINVAHYAYFGEEGDVEISLDIADDTMTLRLTDSGMPFDPLAKEDPDVTLDANKRRIGGLGIYMVKKTMDAMTYAYENGQNIVTITNKIR